MNKINDTFFNILEEQNILKTTKTKPIVNAIKNRHPITFYYSGPRKPKKESVKAGKRIEAEAVALGLSKRGNLIMRAWVQPPSTSKKGFNKHGWRTYMLSRMNNVEIHDDKTFDIPRDKFNGSDKDDSMSVTYVSSVFGSKVKSPKKQKEPLIKPNEPSVTPNEPTPPSLNKTTPEKEPETPIGNINQVKSDKVKPPKPTAKPEPTATSVKPEPKPEVQNVEPTVKPEPKTQTVEPTVKPEELPQPQPKKKPSKNPDEGENEKLNESIRKIKSLMFS